MILTFLLLAFSSYSLNEVDSYENRVEVRKSRINSVNSRKSWEGYYIGAQGSMLFSHSSLIKMVLDEQKDTRRSFLGNSVISNQLSPRGYISAPHFGFTFSINKLMGNSACFILDLRWMNILTRINSMITATDIGSFIAKENDIYNAKYSNTNSSVSKEDRDRKKKNDALAHFGAEGYNYLFNTLLIFMPDLFMKFGFFTSDNTLFNIGISLRNIGIVGLFLGYEWRVSDRFFFTSDVDLSILSFFSSSNDSDEGLNSRVEVTENTISTSNIVPANVLFSVGFKYNLSK